MDRLYFIVNPTAGSGKSSKLFSGIRRTLDEVGADYGFALTERPKHAVSLADTALSKGERRIVAVGGDGTVNEVASALCSSGATMGILPFGTGNDLARALHLPSSPSAALDVLYKGVTRSMDAGIANDHFFANVSGFGFDVDVLLNTARYKKSFRGMLPYLLGIFSTISHLRTLHLIVKVEDRTICRDSLLITVGNGTHFGGGMNAMPNADPFDGLFDVMIVKKVQLLRFLSLLPSFIQGKHLGFPEVECFRAKELTVECPERSLLNLDGELDSNTPVHFKLLPGALNMLVPCRL